MKTETALLVGGLALAGYLLLTKTKVLQTATGDIVSSVTEGAVSVPFDVISGVSRGISGGVANLISQGGSDAGNVVGALPAGAGNYIAGIETGIGQGIGAVRSGWDKLWGYIFQDGSGGIGESMSPDKRYDQTGVEII
jgi:hypothetical protein